MPVPYERACREFSWDEVFGTYDWNAPEELNITHETVTRNVGEGTAIRWISDSFEETAVSYEQLERKSAKIANALEELGIGRGDTVATLLPPIPKLYPVMFGIWRHGAVDVPLFTAFSRGAIEARVSDADVSVIFTTEEYASNLEEIDHAFDSEIVLSGGGDLRYPSFIERQSAEHETVRTAGDDPSTLIYTSGTTGSPKGVEITHRVLPNQYPVVYHTMDLGEDDLLWTTPDPAWAFGLFVVTTPPLSEGFPLLVYEGGFDPADWYRIMEEFQPTGVVTAPTALRGLMGTDALHEEYRISIDTIISGGEPLNTEVIEWCRTALNAEAYDCFGASETMLVVTNQAGTDLEIRAGSMGKPVPGFDVRALDVTEDSVEEAETGETGTLAIHAGEANFFRGYRGIPDEETFIEFEGKRWIPPGDLVYEDEDGYFWYVARADDVIISAGYRISPFEVENSLLEHDAVVEAAAIGVPNEQRGEIVKAYVVVKPGYEADERLKDGIRDYVKANLARHVYPREIAFIDELPKTSTGKIRRVDLRQGSRGGSA